MILPAELLRAATGSTVAAAALYAEHLSRGCERYGITSPKRLAAFLGQIGHESVGLQHATEVWGPTAQQERYEGRTDLGNAEPGDGRRFCGHGLLQVTGRRNHRAVRDALRRDWPDLDVPDFEAAPELLALPKWAALSACQFWHANGCNLLADEWDIVGLSRLINRGNAKSAREANGEPDRLARTERARRALDAAAVGAKHEPPPAPAEAPSAAPEPVPAQPRTTAMPPFLLAALPMLIDAIPKLGKLFGSGSEVQQRNIAAAQTVAEIVQAAAGAPNIQAAVEAIKAEPALLQKAAQEIEARWYELAEAGGGGIAAARAADAATSARGDMLHSPSFWISLALLPLVYMVVGSVVGLWGESWPSDVRAAIATAVVSLIVGGCAGYYWGQTTSRNRTPA